MLEKQWQPPAAECLFFGTCDLATILPRSFSLFNVYFYIYSYICTSHSSIMYFRYLSILIIGLLFSVSAGNAQKWKLRRYEAIAGIGTAHYFGDIGGTADETNLLGLKDIEIFNTRPSIYVGARYKIRHNMAVKANFIFGFISGDDEGSRNNERNFAFSSKIFEPSAQFEYSVISEEHRYRSMAMFNKRGMINNFSQFNVYGFAGVGAVMAFPKAKKDLVDRYDPDHSKVGLAFPLGIGVKYVFSSHLSLGLEFGGRFTTSDYLDGYTSQYSKANDVYYFAVFHAIYRVKTSRRGFPVIGKRAGSFL
jgi:opacity protein-like surface antigen